MQQVYWNYTIRDDWELPGMARRTHRIEDAIIRTGMQDNNSNAVDLRCYGTIGLIIPALTNCNVTFTVSETEAGVYRALRNAAGAVVTITATTGNMAIHSGELGALSAYRWVRVVTSEDQGEDRIFHFIVKG